MCNILFAFFIISEIIDRMDGKASKKKKKQKKNEDSFSDSEPDDEKSKSFVFLVILEPDVSMFNYFPRSSCN